MTTTRTHLTALCLFVLGLAPLAAGCDDDSITDADFRGCSRLQRPLVEDDVDEDADAQADNFDLCADACDAMHVGQEVCFEIYNQPSSCYAWCQDRFVDGDWGAAQAELFSTCVIEEANPLCYMDVEYLCGL